MKNKLFLSPHKYQYFDGGVTKFEKFVRAYKQGFSTDFTKRTAFLLLRIIGKKEAGKLPDWQFIYRHIEIRCVFNGIIEHIENLLTVHNTFLRDQV